ncbi:glycine cleavage system protein GcvH [Derxia gummosa]|uniref:Glycine cleavage system H protein n=1 Tax=Derxia gummosa DSM 723 TaxID=1121388 RepID=A0A8B6X156_9BURK|nr:glycine cleavage system protein GcvH [Derxia gummosa]
MNLPTDLKYAASHEWAKVGDDGLVWVGISDPAQAALGDIVFVGDVKVGETLAAGDVAAVVESVKAASDIYAPVAGKVVAVNEALADTPELVNTEPYANWIFKLETTAGLDGLLDAAAYAAVADETR